jgi:integrase
MGRRDGGSGRNRTADSGLTWFQAFSCLFKWILVAFGRVIRHTKAHAMASFYERPKSPFYWIKAKGPMGEIVRFSSGIRVDSAGSVRKIQQRVAQEREKEARFEQDGSAAVFRAWVPGWINHHYAKEKTRERVLNAWAWLSTYLSEVGVIHPEEVTYQLAQEYMAWRTDPDLCEEEERRCAKWNTALLEVRFLGSIMQEALARQLCIANPCARLRLGRRDTKEKQEISMPVQTAIELKLKDADQWMQDSWMVGIKHGCRISATKVAMTNVDEARMTISFREKGDKVHTAPLHKDLLPLVKRRREEGATFLVDLPANAPKLWWSWFRDNGFQDLSFHCLRVTVITRLARANVSEAKAMQYVGHCNALVHAIYRKLKAADVSELGEFL